MIIVGTDYKLNCTVNIALTDMVSAALSIQAPNGSIVEYDATASGTMLSADITAVQNTTIGEHRVWAEINFLGSVVRKSGAKVFTVWPEGSLQV